MLDFLFPPQCLCCRKSVEKHGTLCDACWKELDYLTAPFCPQCACPLAISSSQEELCGRCLDEHPFFDEARSVFIYNPLVRRLVLRFKNYGATYMAPLFACWMIQKAQSLLAKTHLIVPVPLHWRRLLVRGYNQSALVAKAISNKSGIPLSLTTLKKKYATPSHGRLCAKARLDNVKGSYTATRALQGKNILLVDDIMTSGATANQCAYILKKGGAEKVFLVTLARGKNFSDS